MNSVKKFDSERDFFQINKVEREFDTTYRICNINVRIMIFVIFQNLRDSEKYRYYWNIKSTLFWRKNHWKFSDLHIILCLCSYTSILNFERLSVFVGKLNSIPETRLFRDVQQYGIVLFSKTSKLKIQLILIEFRNFFPHIKSVVWHRIMYRRPRTERNKIR